MRSNALSQAEQNFTANSSRMKEGGVGGGGCRGFVTLIAKYFPPLPIL